MGLIDDLGAGNVGIDTAILIYFIEEQPKYLPIIRPLFEEADRGTRELVTSRLTLLEVLVVPYRAGDLALAERYEALLTRSRGIRLVELTGELLKTAAKLRASSNVKTPDAIQLASALGSECKTFLTNDRRLPSVPGLRVLELDSYVSDDGQTVSDTAARR